MYDYLLFDSQMVQLCFRFRPLLPADAYLSEDLNSEIAAIRKAIALGYRWVRSENEIAVFEKALAPDETPLDHSALRK